MTARHQRRVKQNANKPKPIKAEFKSVQIVTADGRKGVDGVVFNGVLAVTQTPTRDEYTITHVKSGMTLSPISWFGKTHAKQACRRLLELHDDWNFEPGDDAEAHALEVASRVFEVAILNREALPWAVAVKEVAHD